MTDFQYLQRTYARADLAGQAEGLREDGFALIPGVLDAQEIEKLRGAIDRLQSFGFDRVGPIQEHYKCVFNRERAFLDLVDRDGVADLAEELMGEQSHIIGMTAWRSRPGYDGVGIHLDDLMVPLPEATFEDPTFTLPIFICTAHYYLNDIPHESYCPTYVIPGSHKAGRRPGPDELEWHGKPLEPVLVKAGDVLFFRSEIWHSGSANTSDTTRYLLQVHYSHRFIAQKFSPFPWTFNPEILALASERQLKFLGKHPESSYG